jgi:serine/threonine protein kinase
VEECKAEIRNLQGFVNQDQDRPTRLLWAFQHKKQFHLVFPWEDANLLDFWIKEYPGGETPPRDHSLARWVSKVILGLAEGLQMIHGPEVPGSTENNRRRHGDLKPENILWFKGPGCDDLGGPTCILQICDFGLADFRRTQSALVPAGNIGGLTHAYRTPEWDALNPISPLYDIWFLGYVLLEFVTWYILGAKGLRL